jgi:hypothetical protein
MPDPTPSATLARWRAIADAATPGPWEAHSHQRQYSIWHDELDQPLAREVRTWDDAVFMSAARTMMPRLVAVAEAVLALHQPVKKLTKLGPPAFTLCADDEQVWPCSTYVATTTALTGTENGSAPPAGTGEDETHA